MGLGIKGDYTGFSFNGIHTSDLGITRVSGGDRYEEDLFAAFEDKVVDNPGGDGSYYFGTLYKNREFSFNIAFDEVTELQLRQIRQTFSISGVHPLILDEYPYKAYYMKISSVPSFHYVAFEKNLDNEPAHIWSYRDEESGDEEETTSNESTPMRYYAGELDVNFVSYEPFAHCTQKVLSDYATSDWNYLNASGLLSSQDYWDNAIDELIGGKIKVYNPGDFDTPFKLIFTGTASGTFELEIEDYGSFEFRAPEYETGEAGIVYDSRLHLLYGIDSEGNSTGTVYNKYITAGDFFLIPRTVDYLDSPVIDESDIGEDLLITKPAGYSVEIQYDYLYL